MGTASARIRAVLDRRFSIGIVLLAIASTVTFATSLHLSRTESHRAEAISLVAGQRALSQRIAFLVSALEENPSGAMADELAVTAGEMAANHDLLTGRSDGRPELAGFAEPIRGVYFSGFMPFDLAVQRFVADAQTVSMIEPGSAAWKDAAAMRASVVSAGSDSMMQTHGLMVRIMEVEAQAAVAQAERADTLLWGLVILLLLGITTGIYMPIRRYVERSITELETAEARASRAAREADAANAAKGHFLQAASHELKTPLNAITGFADVLRQRTGTDDEDGTLGQMQLASEHLSVLLDAILDTHRADEGTLTLTDEPFEAAKVIGDVVRLAGGLADRKGLRFEARLDIEDGLTLRGDGGRIRQLCLNLVDNAVKFTEAGSVTLDVSARVSDAEASLRIDVVDTGRGIKTDQLERVFDRFNATGEITARRGGGLGIGLALTRQLAQLMGGTVEIESEQGRGTLARLTLELPVAAKAAAPTIGAAEPGRAPRVLIVDDNAPNRMVADALVRSCGGLTVMAADGAQAVEAASAAATGGQPFDLVLMDISMPVMDGIQATKAIRAGGGTGADVPIVAVTAHVAQSDVPAMLGQGFDAVIHKPVRLEVIQEAMDRWVAPLREAG